MLTNTERQQIVEEVNTGTYGIDEALDDIAAAQKGEEVRKALYAEALVLNREGHAGSTDMIARQQIANLQTSINGQISTLRTEVGDDIDDLEEALNSGLATQNGRIAAQDATIANVVANYNVEYGSTELWASTGETGALAAGTTVTLSEDVSHFDYVDIYSFCGNSNVLDTVPVDAKLQSSQGYALRWVNLSDPDSGSYKAYVRIIETRLHIIGTTLTIDHQVTYRNGEEVNISGAEITQSNRSTYVGELGIMKVVGRKITANTEIEDVRIGADGTTYNSAGAAVRAQVTALESAIPAVDSTLSTQGAAADAKVAGDKVAELKSAINKLTPAATNADVGKALIVKTVVDGKPTEYEYGEAGVSSADILVHGKNLFDGVWTEGYFVNQTNGQLAEGTSYKVTDYIQIEPSTAYTISSYYDSSYNINGLRYAVYDENKDFISGAASTPTFTSEANAKYVRFSLLKVFINAQLEEGTTHTSYEQYEEYLDPALVWSPAIEGNVEQKIASTPLSVTPKDTTFFVPSPNLFNPSTAVENELVNQTTGVFQASTGYTRSGYIPIEGGKPYSFVSPIGSTNHYLRYAFYKADKTFIRGAYGMLSEIDHVDAPTDAAYIAVAVLTTLMPYMVAQADTIPSYYPYEYTYINPEYIVSEQANDIIVNIPQKIYATEGIELNLYFEDLTEDWERYTWNIDCPVGRQMARGYNLTPASEQAGTYTLSITAKAKDGVTKRVNASLIVTSKTAGDGESVSILILGDSTTANGIAVSKINENFTGDGMTVSMLGTLGTAPNNHEGRSGWTFAQYFNTASSNAFYNPSTNTFDASYYFSSTGIAKPNWFIINLGINDTFNYTSDSDLDTAISTIIGLCNSMIASVKSASPNSKIGICLTIPPNHSQDAFGKAYACNQTRDRYKRNNTLWVQKQIEEYDGRESEGIYLIPIHTNLDTINNMGMETLPVNARNTAVTYQSPIANGGVHPMESGYWQIADVYTAFLKAQAN